MTPVWLSDSSQSGLNAVFLVLNRTYVPDKMVYSPEWGDLMELRLKQPDVAPVGALDDLALRGRLLERLRAHPTTTAMLIAPSGFGKSVLLAQLAETDPRETVYLHLSEQHNDPTLLANSIADALGEHDSDAAERLRDARKAPEPHVEGVIIPRLVDLTASHGRPFLLILDELEHLHTDGALAVVFALCERMPAGSQFVLASRVEPPLRLGLLRARRGLIEIRQDDLKMNRQECAFLLERVGVTLSASGIDAVLAKTDGWAAAVYLAGLAIGQGSDHEAEAARIAGDDRILAEFLQEEFLDNLAPDRLEFLSEISVLDRISGGACDALTGRSDSGRLLSEIADSNMLLTPLDRTGSWYRLHPLLRDVLTADMRRTSPATEALLNLRASHWWEQAGDTDRAITHAVAALDVERAGALLWSNISKYIPNGRIASVRGWLDQMGDQLVAQNAGLALSRTMTAMTMGRCPEAEHWAAIAGELLESEEPSELRAPMAGGVLLAKALSCRSGIAAMRASVADAEASLPTDDPWRSVCALLDGVGLHFQGDLDAARLRLRECVRRGSVAAPNVQILGLAQLSVLETESGDLHAAAEELWRARGQIERYGLGHDPIMALQFAASAAFCARNGESELAAKDITTAVELVEKLDEYAPWLEAETRILIARAAIRLGDRSHAQEMIAQAARYLEELPDAGGLRTAYDELVAAAASNGSAGAGGLTTAELRILQFLDTHLSLPAIGESISLSPNTVKTHVRNIYSKLEVNSRQEAVERARELGLLD